MHSASKGNRGVVVVEYVEIKTFTSIVLQRFFMGKQNVEGLVPPALNETTASLH